MKRPRKLRIEILSRFLVSVRNLSDRALDALTSLDSVVSNHFSSAPSPSANDEMGMRAGRKCEPVISRLFGCREFRPDFPCLQISFVVVRSRNFKIVVKIRCVCLWAGPNFADRSHQCRRADGKPYILSARYRSVIPGVVIGARRAMP